MKKPILSLAMLAVAGTVFGQTDQNIVAVQNRLKAEGFYLDKPTGILDKPTRIALTQYQVRHGLASTGRLDTPTIKALNASAPKPQPTPEQLVGRWERLASGEMQFIQEQPPPTAPPQGAAKPAVTPASSAPLQAAPPAEAPPVPNAPASVSAPTAQPSLPSRPNPLPATPVVAPRATPAPIGANVAQPRGPRGGANTELATAIRYYVEAFVQAGVARPQGAEINFFAGAVDYFGRPNVSREEIERDLARYNEKWPRRTFWIDGDIQIEQAADSNEIKVVFPLRYELRNGSRYATGRVLKSLTLTKTAGNEMQIVAVNEWKPPE